MSSSLYAQSVVVEDFEDYSAGELPIDWKWLAGQDLVPVDSTIMYPEIYFEVLEEADNKFVRAHVKDRYHRIILENGKDIDWDLDENPILEWDWRAVRLPEGADELKKKKNDTGAAVYLYWKKRDFFGRPRAIKYTYSSSRKVESSKRYGALKLIVASSALDTTDAWVSVRRNVVEDYERLFGEKPDRDPVMIALWSDSDNTDDTAIVDFDNIEFGKD